MLLKIIWKSVAYGIKEKIAVCAGRKTVGRYSGNPNIVVVIRKTLKWADPRNPIPSHNRGDKYLVGVLGIKVFPNSFSCFL